MRLCRDALVGLNTPRKVIVERIHLQKRLVVRRVHKADGPERLGVHAQRRGSLLGGGQRFERLGRLETPKGRRLRVVAVSRRVKGGLAQRREFLLQLLNLGGLGRGVATRDAGGARSARLQSTTRRSVRDRRCRNFKPLTFTLKKIKSRVSVEDRSRKIFDE